jgi:putative alpha-1,2-mannosidase
MLVSCNKKTDKLPANYINPFTGASTSMEIGRSLHGLGKTFPGAATPFGMIQLSPDTRTGGDNAPITGLLTTQKPYLPTKTFSKMD